MNSLLCLGPYLILSTNVWGEAHKETPQEIALTPAEERRIGEMETKELPTACLTPPGTGKPFFTNQLDNGLAVEHYLGPFGKLVKADYDNGTSTPIKDLQAYPVVSKTGNWLIQQKGEKMEVELISLTPPFESKPFMAPELHESLIKNLGSGNYGPEGVFSADEKTVMLKDNAKQEWLVIEVESQKILNRIPIYTPDAIPVFKNEDPKLSADGKKVAFLDSSGTVSIFETRTGEKIFEKQYGSVNQPRSGDFSQDGTRVAAARKPGNVIEVMDVFNKESLYAVNIGKLLGKEFIPLPAHFKPKFPREPRATHVWSQFIPGTNHLVAGIKGTNLFVILNDRGKVVGRYQSSNLNDIYDATITSDGKSLLARGATQGCRITLP